MIVATLIAPQVIQVSGMSDDVPASVWFAALERMGALVQGRVRYSYGRERAKDVVRFRPNSPKWNAYKAKKGYDSRRGHMERRINRALGREPFYRVTAVRGGVARIVFVEEALYDRQPHARWYAKLKVPGGRILQLNAGWLARALAPVQAVDARRQREEQAKRQAETRRLEFGRDLFSQRRQLRFAYNETRPGVARRPWTLAATATSVTTQCIAALRRG